MPRAASVTLEETLCGYVREGDVAGFEIPARYFHYVHAGDARPLAAVFEHNRLDLLSLALVTARAAQLLDEGAPGARTAREALGMGRLYERGGMMPEAKSCFARAAEFEEDDEELIAEALRAYAIVSRRLRQYDDAAAAWRRVLGLPVCPRPIAREASEALAVHLEHRRRDLMSARDFAVRLLRVDESVTRRQAAEYRLARLDRKLESSSGAACAADLSRSWNVEAGRYAVAVFLAFLAAPACFGRFGGRSPGDLHGLRGGLPLLRGLRAELLVEPLDAAFGVDQLLTSGEERMAVRADFEVELGFRRARLEGVAARAASLDLLVLRVNPFLHCLLLRGWWKRKLYTTPAAGQLHGPQLRGRERWIVREIRHNSHAELAFIGLAGVGGRPRS